MTPLPLPQSLYGRTDGRSYGHVITKFSGLDGLPNFLTHGAPLARFARWSSAKKAGVGSDLNISKTQIRKVLKLGHGAPQLGSPMPMHRMALRPNRTKKPTNTSSMKKDGGKLLSKKVSFRSPPIIGKWSDYDRFLQTGGLILPRATKKS